MDIDLGKGTVTIYEVKCSLCGQKIRSAEKNGCHELLVKHVDNECKIAQTMRDWEKQGIYKEMMGFVRKDALIAKLEKLLKHYSFEEVKEAFEGLEIDKAETA